MTSPSSQDTPQSEILSDSPSQAGKKEVSADLAKTPGQQRGGQVSQHAVKTLGSPLLLAALLIAGVASWQWYSTRQQLSTQQQGWEKRLGDADIATQDSRNLVKQAQEQNQALQARFSSLEERLNQESSTLTSLQDIAINRDLALLTEIEHALVLTVQQLQVSADISTTLTTLQAVDHRLSKIDRPQLGSVRKAISRDIERLKKLPAVDITGMNQRLENLLVGIDRLPLNMDARPAAQATNVSTPDAPAWINVVNGLWAEIKDLIRIERMDGASPLLLSNEQQFFVRESLKLRLLSARLSLLARDQHSFRHELDASQELLNHHFNAEDKTVQQTRASLKQLQETTLPAEMPSLAESLNAVRLAQQQTEKKSKP